MYYSTALFAFILIIFIQHIQSFPSTSDRSPSATPRRLIKFLSQLFSHEKNGSQSSTPISNAEFSVPTSISLAQVPSPISSDALPDQDSNAAVSAPAPNAILASTAAVPASNADVPASTSSGTVQQNSASIKGKEIDEAQSSPACPICLEKLNEGNQSEALPCAHVFHQHCLTKWLTTKDSCPVCRKVVGQKKKSDQRNQPSSSQMRDDRFYYTDDGEGMLSCYSMEEYDMRH